MEEYKTRKISFLELQWVNDWAVKIYGISKHGSFNQPEFLKVAKKKISQWLKQENGFDSSHDQVAFIIFHAGTEGIFSIVNWWVGSNMLNTNIYISDYDNPSEFRKISGEGLAPCTWELEVINHERVSWINNILKKASNPDFEKYLSDVINKEM